MLVRSNRTLVDLRSVKGHLMHYRPQKANLETLLLHGRALSLLLKLGAVSPRSIYVWDGCQHNPLNPHRRVGVRF